MAQDKYRYVKKILSAKTRDEALHWLKEDIKLALRRPNRDKVHALIKRFQEEDKNDPCCHKIQLFAFSSVHYYLGTVEVVKDIVKSLERNDIEVRNNPNFRLIEVAFHCEDALREFYKNVPFYSGSLDDSYHFIELQRDTKTRTWDVLRIIKQGNQYINYRKKSNSK
jgi:hypothetical protein